MEQNTEFTDCIDTTLQIDNSHFIVVSYNMHGFNQGLEGTKDIINKLHPDIIALQEHWLTPTNLHKLCEVSEDYFFIGSSSMGDVLTAGPLFGRPFGGTAILINSKLANATVNVVCNDRFTAVLVSECLVISAYMPCVGTCERMSLYSAIISEIQALIEVYPQYKMILCADFNVALDAPSSAADLINNFICSNNLRRTDLMHPTANRFTYTNESLHVESYIDYIISSTALHSIAFNVLDLDINLSDHLPIMCVFVCKMAARYCDPSHSAKFKSRVDDVSYFRWDHAALHLYYEQTRMMLEPILDELNIFADSVATVDVFRKHSKLEDIYNSVVAALVTSANMCIPKLKKNFFRFWWNQELSELKAAAVTSARAWQQAGKPKHGSVYRKYHKDKLLYKKCIRENQQQESVSFTNDLHEALLRKNGKDFWKTWNAKIGVKRKYIGQVDGIADGATIACNFAKHFEKVCQPATASFNSMTKTKFEEMRSTYYTPSCDESVEFDVQLISKIVSDMSDGKAAGLDELSVEHLKHCHPIAIIILCKLFNLFVQVGYLPCSFGTSYTVPIPKQDGRFHALSVNDFRGISISPVISKIFEHAVFARFGDYFTTSDHQFGFKEKLSCSHAIYCVRNVIDHYVSRGSTVNICTVDLSKAFDTMNHFVLFTKLMERKFPVQLLDLFVLWFTMSETCVRWGSHDSYFFKLNAGVRQGGVLSPYLFALFIDDLVNKIAACNSGCYTNKLCSAIFMYADDIILLSPSVCGLQSLLRICESAITELDMKINATKTVCMRIGPRFNSACVCPNLMNGVQLKWVETCKYLGVYFVAGRSFTCSFEEAKKKFYVSFNAVYSRIGCFASEEVTLNLLNVKCVSAMLYAIEACPVMSRHKHSFDFVITRVCMKILRTGSPQVVAECQKYFGFLPLRYQIDIRTAKFLERFCNSVNPVCLLFKNRAILQLNNLYAKYDSNVENISDLLRSVNEKFGQCV